MPKSARKPKHLAKPAWAAKIANLRLRLALNQEIFGQKLDCSAMAISRWERGVQEPTAASYIQLGNLAGDPDCWYFWARAGLRNEDILRVMPVLRERLLVTRMPDFEFVSAGAACKTSQTKVQLVAIPLLKIVAAAHGEKGDTSLLHDAAVEGMMAAPRDWCPNPAQTSCLRVQGKSMMPLINDGYIVAVDSSQNDKNKLNGKVVIAWHRERGLIVSRLRRFDHTEILQPENGDYESVTLRDQHGWNILAKVLWWIGKAP